MSIRRFWGVLVVVVVAGVVGGILLGSLSGWRSTLVGSRQAFAAPLTPGTVYVPIVARNHPLNDLFGVEMYQITTEMGLEQVIEAGAKWIRRNALLWSQAEPVRGEYNWNSQPVLQQELITASDLGVQVILIVRSAPEWAREIKSKDCSRIKRDALPAFADFMYETVKRYSAPPYNVKYWQIWNEPDVPPSVAVPGGINGCWGDPDDPYYGGGYYADVLQTVYARIKEADPEAMVVVGGLLLDCNNRDDCPKYLEGILFHNGANNGGNFFDVVAYHAYDYYFGGLGRYGNLNWNSRWDGSGPVIIAKASHVRDLLALYNVRGKTIMATEAALLCGVTGLEPYCLTAEFENTKAFFVAQLYAAAQAERLQANVWYHLLGWRGSGLLDENLNPLPAYYAYAFARKEISKASFNRQITEYPDVKGYEFNRSDGLVWLVWSRDGLSREISLPSSPTALWDALGNAVPVTGSTLEVTIKPLYVEWALR